MKNLIKNHRFLASALSVLVSVFLVSMAVYAATTIGTNISTDGNLTVTGDITTTGSFSGPGSFVINSDGNIGIGTTTPKQMLTIEGGGLCIDDGTGICGSQTIAQGNLYVKSATTTGSLHIGGNADVDGTLDIGGGTTIAKFTFGDCNIADTAVTASSTAYIDCTDAVGVAAGDNVFVTATSSLPTNFIIQAASSTVADTINIRILNLGLNATTQTGGHSFYWQAIK